MSALIRFINSKLKPYTTIIIVVFMILVISLVGMYMYKNGKLFKTKKNDFKDVANTNDKANNKMLVYLFTVDWCPHCVKAKPEWMAFQKEKDGKTVNNCLIECKGINCTNEEDNIAKSLIAQYHIESYPTVFIIKNDIRYDFDSKVTSTSLNKFVEFVSEK